MKKSIDPIESIKQIKPIELIFLIIGLFIGTFILALLSNNTIAFLFFLPIEKNNLESFNIYQETYERVKAFFFSPVNIISTILLISILVITIIIMIQCIFKKEKEIKKTLIIICMGLSIIFGILLGCIAGYKINWNNAFMCSCGNHLKTRTLNPEEILIE